MKARATRLVSLLVSGTCAFGFLLWAANQRVPRLPSGLDEGLALLLGVMAYTVATLGLCERWRFLLRRHAPGLSRLAGYRPVVLGQLSNVFLPARGGDGLRVGLVATMQNEISARTVVGTVVAERALDISCHVVLLTVVMIGMFGPSAGVLGNTLTILVGLILLAGATIALYMMWHSIASRLGIKWRVPESMGPLLAPLLGLRHNSGKAILLSVAMWTGEVVGWWAAAYAVGLELSLLQAAYVFAIASLALIMPVGFGSIGTLDAGILFSLKTVGASTASVLSFVLLLRMLFVLPSLAMIIGIELQRLTRARSAIASAAARRRPSVDA